jgi:hypothetical protein
VLANNNTLNYADGYSPDYMETEECADPQTLFNYFRSWTLSRRAQMTLQEIFHSDDIRSQLACEFIVQVNSEEKIRRHRMGVNEVIILQQICSRGACYVYEFINGLYTEDSRSAAV